MLFNLFKKIFWGEKREAEKTKQINIDLGDILNFVEKQTKKKQIVAKKKAGEIVNAVYTRIMEFKSKTQELKEAKPKEEITIHKNFDLKIKNDYCDRVLASINVIEKPKIEQEKMIDFLNNCRTAFRIAGGLTSKDNYIITRFFKENLKEYIDASTKTQDAMAELSKFINEEGKITEVEEDISKILARIQEIENNLSEKQKKFDDFSENTKLLEKNTNALNMDIADIENNKEFFECRKLNEEIQVLTQEKIKTHQHISNIFDKSRKMIKKYWYIHRDTDKDFIKKIEDFLDFPAETFLREKTGDKYPLIEILLGIDTAIKNKIFDFDEKERQQWINFRNSFNITQELEHKKQYLYLQEKVEKETTMLKIKTEKHLNKKEIIAEKIRDNAEEVQNLEKQKKYIDESMRALELDLKRNKDALNDMVNWAVGGEVNILYKKLRD